MTTVFIDGAEGTTGLQIRERLTARKDIKLITLPENKRKELSARREALNDCDISILCLPDAAATEAVSLIESPRARVLDASTAHRCKDGWVYGFPEIVGTEKVKTAKRLSVPGCHASGAIACLYPIRKSELLSKDAYVSVLSVTGYTGGGKKMIAAYEDAQRPGAYDSPRQYALSQTHKHLPEIVKYALLARAPAFCPVVGDFPRGMTVTVPVFDIGVTRLRECLESFYQGKIVRMGAPDADGFLSANALAGTDGMEITVCGNDERALVISRFDNLGKGASGAAVQCLNLMLGCEETEGLIL